MLRGLHQDAHEAALGQGQVMQRINGGLANACTVIMAELHQQVDAP